VNSPPPQHPFSNYYYLVHHLVDLDNFMHGVTAPKQICLHSKGFRLRLGHAELGTGAGGLVIRHGRYE
jgi:hypothetical protein